MKKNKTIVILGCNLYHEVYFADETTGQGYLTFDDRLNNNMTREEYLLNYNVRDSNIIFTFLTKTSIDNLINDLKGLRKEMRKNGIK
jgi:hypothetical protein